MMEANVRGKLGNHSSALISLRRVRWDETRGTRRQHIARQGGKIREGKGREGALRWRREREREREREKKVEWYRLVRMGERASERATPMSLMIWVPI